MAFWRKKRESTDHHLGDVNGAETTDHYVGDFGSAEIKVTDRQGELPLVSITVSMTPEFACGLDFQNKRDELGLHHPKTLRALHLYAFTLGDLPDRRDEAIELLDWLVAALTDDPENRLPALNDLTRLLQDSGRLAVAEQRLREALSGWERLRGQDDPQTLQIAGVLAGVLIDLGRREEAEGLMRDTVARRARALGATHPETLTSMNILAGTLRGSPSRLAEAERMYEAILAGTDGINDLILLARHNLAAVLIHQGRHAEALERYRELVDIRARLHGDDHRLTWSSRRNLAVALNSLGHFADAEARLAQVLDAYRRLIGPRHAETLATQTSLAAMKANQGRTTEAVPLLRDAIEGYRGTHGPDHPRVRHLTHVLAQLGE
ncbi:tetratricopeptide repeat protein [Streptomyces niveus]|uniref:tetratricopeptide repeat protein n=1 Tax=Streptomyces niveus TaxID=193462 RepID=UPI00364B02BE